jgi:hypothetical protein
LFAAQSSANFFNFATISKKNRKVFIRRNFVIVACYEISFWAANSAEIVGMRFLFGTLHAVSNAVSRLRVTWWQLAAGGGSQRLGREPKGAVPHCRWDELRPRLWQTAR